MSQTLTLAKALIAKASVTPEDKGCQDLLIARLVALDFSVKRLKFGAVDNFFARRGDAKPLFVFAGHTDVVPEGDAAQWRSPAFAPSVQNGMLYGRGSADMKGSLAAMVVATERFVADYPTHRGAIGFLITSDEEGPATNGTIKVMEYLKQSQQPIDYCLVGEPSSSAKLGDTIKNGRRGSLNGQLRIIGKQGHIAYPQLARNPIHLVAPVLSELCQEVWDAGNEYFPATSFQISNVHSGVGVTNVIPGEIEVVFNFRYSTQSTHLQLQRRVVAILDKYQLDYKIVWTHSGAPFLTPKGDLVRACACAIQNVTQLETQLSTSGGTSDGRFIAPSGAQVVELGPLNATIHQANECVNVQDLDTLTDIYYQILKQLLR